MISDLDFGHAVCSVLSQFSQVELEVVEGITEHSSRVALKGTAIEPMCCHTARVTIGL